MIGMPMTLDDTFLIRDSVAPACRDDILRIAAFEPRSLVAGPGERAVVWVAGCVRRCPGCIKPEYLPFDAGQEVPVAELANRILRIEGLDGVTYSGGEPFEQAAPLAELSRRLKDRGLSVASYSGYRRDALAASPRFLVLLEQLDLLIDGEYRQELPGPYPWRGSANQQIYALTPRGQTNAPVRELTREIQVSLSGDGLRLTGFPDREIQRQLAERLRLRGIHLTEIRD